MLLALLLMGTDPSPSLQQGVKEMVGKELNDPFSAQYAWQPVKDDYLYCGWVNAKNAFGAYVGYRPFMVIYSVNLKTKKADVDKASLKDFVVTKMCLDHGYRLTR